MPPRDPEAWRTAEELLRAHAARERFGSLKHPPADLAAAYRAQDALIEQRCADGDRVGGWKIALTTKVMQEFVGIPHPLAGAILRSGLRRSPGRIGPRDLVHLGVESEIALRIEADVTPEGAPYGRADVARAVGGALPAIEIVEDRHCDYASLDPLALAADNAFNAGCVIGPELPLDALSDLSELAGSMAINGSVVGSGVGADVLGHPLDALAWLANHLIERGRFLRAGDVVLTGSVVPTHWLSPGDEMVTRVDGLGEAVLRVDPA